MNEIKLPPVPKWMECYTIPNDDLDHSQDNMILADRMRQYATEAIEAALQSQDREDAERYRWLRDKSRVFKQDPDMSGNHYWMIQANGLLRGATLDAAIDHARRNEGEK